MEERVVKITCPICAKRLLHAKSGEFEIQCTNPHCFSKWRVIISNGRINYSRIDEDSSMDTEIRAG